MVVASAVCIEKDGPHLRNVVSQEKTHELIWSIFDKVRTIPNFVKKGTLEPRDMRYLFGPSVFIYTIDDVGVAIVRLHGVWADVHITFWDRRMRGRAPLLHKAAAYILGLFQLQWLRTSVPTSSPAVLAFVERIGFVPSIHSSGHVVLEFGHNRFLHRANSA